MLDCSIVSGLLNKKSATMKHLFSQFFSRTLSCAFSCTHRCLLFAELLRRNTLRLSMLMLFVFAASINAWGQTTETVGITATLSTKENNAGSESLLSPAHFTIEKVLGTNTVALSQYNDAAVRPLKHGGSTSFYSKPSYKWNKNLSDFQTDAYVGYKVNVESGYQYNLTALDVDLAVSANFTWKVVISDNAGNELYNTGGKTITNYDKSPSINTTLTADLKNTAKLQNLTGDFSVKFYVYYNSTGKYFCFPKFTIQGNLVASSSSSTTYTVTYNTNGGEAIAQVTNATALPDPLPTTNKVGYDFAGWYTDEAFTTLATAGAPISDNTTLYAKWTPTIYNITYEGLEGATNSGSNPAIYTIETSDITFVAPGERAGYAFAGWSPASIAKGSTGDQTVTAQWKKAHTITFNANGEGATCEPASATCADGESVSLPTPTRDGFTCTGWYDADNGGNIIGAAGASYSPTKDITLYAQWEKIVEPTCTTDVYYNTVPDGKTQSTRFTFSSKPSDPKTLANTMTIGGVDYTCANRSSSTSSTFSFTIPDGKEATLYMCVRGGGSSRVMQAVCGTEKKSIEINDQVNTDNSYKTFTLTNLTAGTWTVTCIEKLGTTDAKSWYLAMLGLQECKTLPACETPFISTQPEGNTYCKGADIVALSVVASVSEGTLLYQWQKDGEVIKDATNATYTPTEKGTYTCVVTNTLDGHTSASKTSDAAVIKINAATTITSHPTNAVIWLSGKTTLAVEAEGAGTLTYQWYTCESKNGSNKQAIEGATAATYTVNPDEEGVTYYKVEVTGTCGTATSDVVSVTANKLCGELIRATLTGATTADVTGAVAGSAEVNTQGDHKLGSNGHFVGVSLKSGYTFQANDTVVINVTTASSFLRIYSDKGKTLLVESSSVTTGENRLVLPEDADGVKTLYLYRTDNKMNPYVSYMAVRRPCCNIPKIRWSAASAEIDFSDVSPALPTLSNTSGLPVSYSSDDTDVATIDENGVVSIKGAGTTSINAIYTATNATYCSHEVSYTLVVRCAVAPLIQQGNNVGSGCNERVELTAVRSDDKSDYGSGSFQWYRNGVVINGAQSKTYTANQVGTYTVSYSPAGVDCSQMSTNKAVVTSSVPQPVVEKKAPHRNYQIANRDLRLYTEDTHYPLFDVTPKATAEYTGEKKWVASYTIHAANTGIITAGKATIDWVREDATTATTISIGANYEALGSWLKDKHPSAVVGDTLMLTMKTINSCDEWDNATADSIPIILTDKYSLAYIVTGNTTTRKFYDITKSDISDPLYTQLRTKYNVTPVSAYATYDYTNYEPYDLLLLTDYPKATGTNAQPDYVNALADLVDKKPILSLKAHMSKLSNWSAKGFTSDPVVPGDGTEGQAQKTLTVLCFSHDMFEGAKWDNDNADDRTLTILDNVYKDSKAYKGIQGFLAINSANFVNIAKVYDAKGDRNLVACCERQDVTKARFIMLSINQGATKYINEKGQDAIDKLLKYLLWTDATNVSDCSLTFDNGEGNCKDCSGGKRVFTKDGKTYTSGDHLWNNPANWNAKAIPTQLQNVRIEADCKVSGNTYGAGNVRIKEGNTLTIAPNGGLASVGQFAYYSGNNWNQPQPITDTKYITVQANAEKTGMLMHSHTDRLAATVEMYSPAFYEDGKVTDGHERIWSYVAIPVQEGTVPQIFNGAYTYLWSEKEGWIRYNDGSTFRAFNGIALSQPNPKVFTFAGNLALAQKYEIELTKTAGGMDGMNLIGNSWTAPIQITKLKDTDFGKGLEATVYIYSTGRDPKNGPATTATEGDLAAGYWTAIPIETAKTQDWDGPKIIPAMQAFEVNFATDATSATLTLDYNTIVRASGVDYSTLNQKLYAPGRNSTAEILQPDPSAPAPYEPTMLRIRVADTAACYNLHLLQGERFSEGFDNGWDGFYTGTAGRAPGLCALTTAGEMQVSAQPEIDNTTLVFTPGRSNTYTFSFCLTETEDEPLAQPLYLNDMQLRKSCLIDDSHTYTFQSSENDMENRFVISHIAFEEQETPTGIANLATVDQQLMLSNPSREALTIRVYDPAGRLCSEMSTREAMLQITLPEPQGVYMIHITGEHTEILRKIVQ